MKNILKRKIDDKLNQWLNTKHALLITGARQVGKSYALLKFAKTKFKHYYYYYYYYYLDFSSNKTLLLTLKNYIDLNDFNLRLSSIIGENFNNKNTLIIFDEIQLV